MGKILKLVWFAAKAGIVGGSVYVTYDQGVWGSQEDTRKLYDNIYKNVPGLKTFREDYIGDLIPKDMSNINFRDYWNSGVLTTFRFIADSPSKAVELKNYVVDYAKTLTAEEPAKTTTTT